MITMYVQACACLSTCLSVPLLILKYSSQRSDGKILEAPLSASSKLVAQEK